MVGWQAGGRAEPRGTNKGEMGEGPCKPERGLVLVLVVQMNRQGIQGVCVCVRVCVRVL